jgi:hypothetical protein
MSEHWQFIKVDVNFPDHPRTIELSDPAFRALVELWCYCKRHQTDGKVPVKHWKTIRKQSRDKLLKHYVKDCGSHVEMVGYLEHQISSEQVAELRKRRAEAGRKGGFAKAKAMALANDEPQQKLWQNPGHQDQDQDQDLNLGGKPPREARKRAHALPDDFQVTELMAAWARKECPGIDIKAETEKFKDWHRAKGSLFKDWAAAWRTWMRRTTPATVGTAPEKKKEWWFNN